MLSIVILVELAVDIAFPSIVHGLVIHLLWRPHITSFFFYLIEGFIVLTVYSLSLLWQFGILSLAAAIDAEGGQVGSLRAGSWCFRNGLEPWTCSRLLVFDLYLLTQDGLGVD